MNKDSQHDFGLTAGPPALLEIIEVRGEARDPAEFDRPLYRPLRDPATASPPEPERGLPTNAKARKAIPIFSGVLKYFPDALAAVAQCSFEGNEQHHPGTPLHWDRTKSLDHEDCLVRHLLDDAMGVPMDGPTPHLAKVAWRALAMLQTRIDGIGAVK